MKLESRSDGEGCLRVKISGLLEGARCRCLSRFFAHRVSNQPESRVLVDLSDVDEIDALATAELASLLTELLQSGRSLDLRRAPQVLAHTLYKSGRLRDPRLSIESRETEEPYAG